MCAKNNSDPFLNLGRPLIRASISVDFHKPGASTRRTRCRLETPGASLYPAVLTAPRSIIETPSIRAAAPVSLDGQYVFNRFNPSAGLTFSPNRFVNLYSSYSESSRAPTSIELGCADPNNPCNLPNALTGDPPLSQVQTRTVEAGVRNGGEAGSLNWSAGWFRASNHDDLLFVTSNQTGNGYFRNFGQTLRQGVETHLSGRIGRITLGGNYTFLRATYESPETLSGSSNSTNDSALSGSRGMDGVIQIQPGNRIPLTPLHMLKTFADVQFTRKISADLNFLAVSSSFARGNEGASAINCC